MCSHSVRPERQDILDFIAQNPGKTGKRDIAKAFKVKGSDRIYLKQLLREMTAEGSSSLGIVALILLCFT